MAKKKTKTSTRYRRADTGQYTTEEYAKKHPKTTVKETDKVPRKRRASNQEQAHDRARNEKPAI